MLDIKVASSVFIGDHCSTNPLSAGLPSSRNISGGNILLHVSKYIQAALILELTVQSFLSFPPHKKLLKHKC